MGNILGKIFNRSNLKLVAALSIPAGITYFWFYSNEQARLEVERYQAEQKQNPLTDNVTVKNYELKEIDDLNHIRWQLVAKKGVMKSATKDVALDEVKVEYFDGQKLKMRLIAPQGSANEATRIVHLDSTDDQKVIAEGGEDGKGRIEALNVELTKKNQFTATGGVNIVWPGVAKVTGTKAIGTIGKGGIEGLKIVGNTHTVIGM
ncbi:MAG TPA: LPS export ABC transporter periplasmic protein LptC [Candidatus Obscuribacterales bacterium]